MKILLLNFAILISIQSFSQKIVEDKIDEFTKDHIKSTSWEKLNDNYHSYLRFRKINDTYWLNLKMGLASVNSIIEKAELLLMTNSDSIITLYNLKYQISCTGCGAISLLGSAATGFNLDFIITEQQLLYLKEHGIKKFRIYTTSGYIEKIVLEKAKKNIIKLLELINS